jgi:cytochrome c biogenesis protein CcmG/thiol:disulfide interchange protein DsbE
VRGRASPALPAPALPAAALPGAALVAALTLAALVQAGCAAAPAAAPPQSAGSASTNPNTPALVAQRQAAGLPDCPVASGGATPLQEGLPDVALPCLGSDRSLSLAQLRGRPLVVNLWAQWCEPCRAEGVILAAFARRAGGSVEVLGVDFDDPDPSAAIAFAGREGWPYPQVVDRAAVLRGRLTLPGVPVTLLVAPDGRVVHRVTGALSSLDQLVGLVRDKLGVTV